MGSFDPVHAGGCVVAFVALLGSGCPRADASVDSGSTTGFTMRDAGSAPDAGPCGTAALIHDGFSAPSPLWTPGPAQFAGNTGIVDGALEIRVGPDAGDTYFGRVTTIGAIDLTDGGITVKVDEVPGAQGADAHLQLVGRGFGFALGSTGGVVRADYYASDVGGTIGDAVVPFSSPSWWRIEEQAGDLVFSTSSDGVAFAPLARTTSHPPATYRISLRAIADVGPTERARYDAVRGGGAGVGACPLDIDDDFAAQLPVWHTVAGDGCDVQRGAGLVATCGDVASIRRAYVETWSVVDLRDRAVDVRLLVPVTPGIAALVEVASTTTFAGLQVLVFPDRVEVALPAGDGVPVIGSRALAATPDSAVVVRVRAGEVEMLDADGAHVVATYPAVDVDFAAAILRVGMEHHGERGDDVSRVVVDRVTTRYAPRD